MSVGAAPIIFITNRQGALANVTDATEAQLQQAFSGVKCSGNVFAGGGAGDIQVYLREPLSGTMNTTEYTVFRYPDCSGIPTFPVMSGNGCSWPQPTQRPSLCYGGSNTVLFW